MHSLPDAWPFSQGETLEVALSDLLTRDTHDRTPLWFVYADGRGRTTIQPATVNRPQGKAAIWGFSVYRRSGDYRTLGTSLDGWAAGTWNLRIYTAEGEALAAAGGDYIVGNCGDMPTPAQLQRLLSKGRIRSHDLHR